MNHKQKSIDIKKANGFQTPNLERALQIIELMSGHKGAIGISEIARLLDIPKNSVYRITGTLHAHGYMIKDEENKTLKLSRKLIDIGFSALSEQDLLEKSLDIMRELRDATGETVLLGVLLETDGVILNQVVASHPIKLTVDIGIRFNLHCSAPGKVLMAFSDEDIKENHLKQIKYVIYNERTISNESDFLIEIDKIRYKGYSTDLSEQFEGVHCVGAPVFGHDGKVIAAVWVTGPSYRFPEKDFEKIGNVVKMHAKKISQRFGFQDNK